jgi:hypothetical protein
VLCSVRDKDTAFMGDSALRNYHQSATLVCCTWSMRKGTVIGGSGEVVECMATTREKRTGRCEWKEECVSSDSTLRHRPHRLSSLPSIPQMRNDWANSVNEAELEVRVLYWTAMH